MQGLAMMRINVSDSRRCDELLLLPLGRFHQTAAPSSFATQSSDNTFITAVTCEYLHFLSFKTKQTKIPCVE
jgi:hypothetical protein